MNEENVKNCPKCGGTMIRKHDYLPDDIELKEVKDFWLCTNCMSYQIIE